LLLSEILEVFEVLREKLIVRKYIICIARDLFEGVERIELLESDLKGKCIVVIEIDHLNLIFSKSFQHLLTAVVDRSRKITQALVSNIFSDYL